MLLMSGEPCPPVDTSKGHSLPQRIVAAKIPLILEGIQEYCVEGVRGFFGRHPLVIGWVALAIGMVAIMLWASKDVGLLPGQVAALVVATIALAGACVWIISWD